MEKFVWIMKPDGTMEQAKKGHWFLSNKVMEQWEKGTSEDMFKAAGLDFRESYVSTGENASDFVEGVSEYISAEAPFPRVFYIKDTEGDIGFIVCEDLPSYLAACNKVLPIAQYWRTFTLITELEVAFQEGNIKQGLEAVLAGALTNLYKP